MSWRIIYSGPRSFPIPDLSMQAASDQNERVQCRRASCIVNVDEVLPGVVSTDGQFSVHLKHTIF